MNKSHLSVVSIMSTTIWTGIARKHCVKLQRNHNRYKETNHVNGKHIRREETKKDKPIIGNHIEMRVHQIQQIHLGFFNLLRLPN